MGHIYRWELRRRWRGMLGWGLGHALLNLFFFAFYPAFARDAAAFQEIVRNYPPALRQAFGIEENFTTVLGFYAVVLLMGQVLLAIQAAAAGFGLVALEESDQTADFLLSKPVSRLQVLTGKLLAAGTALLGTAALAAATAWGGIQLFRDGHAYDSHTLLLLWLSMLPFQLFFLSTALGLSLWAEGIDNPLPWALGWAFGLYFLGAFGGMARQRFWDYLSPFRHFSTQRIVARGAWDARLAWFDVGVSLVALLMVYYAYPRRDIPTR